MKYLTFLLMLTVQFCTVSAQYINTIVGNGLYGCMGDGGPALAARLYSSASIAVNPGGDSVYMSDFQCLRVRMCDANGIINTVAGNGAANYNGDNIAAVNATLSDNEGIAVDAAGNLYIADQYHNRLRMVDPAGIITTIAGTGQLGFSGDGGQATAARINGPEDVALDVAGNIYFTDAGNFRIRKIDVSGIISTIAGTGVAGDTGDGGPATAAEISTCKGICVDAGGNIYFTEVNQNLVRKIDANGIISTLAGTGVAGYSGDGGPAGLAEVNQPEGICADGQGNVYIADFGNHRVRKVDANGIITTFIGTGVFGFGGDGGPAIDALVADPADITMDAAGNFYLADYGNHRVRKICMDDVLPQAAINNINGNPSCAGDSLLFTVSVTNPGPGMSYQWYRNNSPVGSNSDSLLLAGANNGSTIYCIVSRAGSCTAMLSDTSDTLSITVLPDVTPGISISVSPGDTVCNEANLVQFSSVVSNGGPTPQYEWLLNGQPWGTGASLTISVNDGDELRCVLTSSAACAVPQSDTSNSITMTVLPNLLPQVSIAVSPDTNIQPNESVTFTATVTNGGPNPAYQWTKNNVDLAGAMQPVYSTNSLQEGDAVRCRVNSSGICSDTSLSLPLVMHVSSGISTVLPAGMRIYPNPVQDVLYIEYQGMAAAEMVLEDISGRVLAGGPLGPQFCMGRYAPGVYILQVTELSSGRRYTCRIVKE